VRVGFSTSGPRQGELIDRMLDAGDSPFSAVQTTWNLLEPSAGDALARANDARWLVVVKESLANGRLAGGSPGTGGGSAASGSPGSPASPEQRAAALAEVDGQPLAGFALGAAVAEPWADIVLTGAVTRRQLRENVAAQPPRVPADALAALAEPPEQYWAARSARPWS
jgi:aryl-alcohol dehydrogenase-like predicted oxidoreductase